MEDGDHILVLSMTLKTYKSLSVEFGDINNFVSSLSLASIQIVLGTCPFPSSFFFASPQVR